MDGRIGGGVTSVTLSVVVLIMTDDVDVKKGRLKFAYRTQDGAAADGRVADKRRAHGRGDPQGKRQSNFGSEIFVDIKYRCLDLATAVV